MKRLIDSRGWDAQAKCKTGTDPDLFFVIDDDRPSMARDLQEAEAKKVCSRCPVSGNCFDYALEYGERYGVWGGATESERRAAHRGGSRLGCPKCKQRLTTRDENSQICLGCGLTWLL